MFFSGSIRRWAVHLTNHKTWSSIAVHKLDARVTSSIYLEQTKVTEERATFIPHSKFKIGQQVVTFMIEE